jgi:transglutaminase-like putative cysteine protease
MLVLERLSTMSSQPASRREETVMNRRAFLKASTAVPVVAAAAQLPGLASIGRAQQKEFDPRPGAWRTFEITTRVEVLNPRGVSRLWLPVPSVKAEFQRPIDNRWSGNARTLLVVDDGKHDARMLYVEFAESQTAPVAELVSVVQTRSRSLDWSKKDPAAESAAGLRAWTAATALMPTDGIVKDTAVEITSRAGTDLERVKAVYDWILVNTYREPKVRGCGTGDIVAMLETRNFGGKCGDINALFVGLLRSVGVPARDIYGIRVAPSAFGYRALGAGSANITKAQHCRAEVFLRDYGWVAMDPADVGKVAREETSEWLKIDHPLVAAVRPKLFGGWEGNWIGFNMSHDVALPNATKGGKLAFLMYPQGETAEGRRDSLDPDSFRYTITSRESKS